MGNVIELPDRPVREWFVVERRLRADMAVLTTDADMINHLCEVMRPIFLQHAASQFRLDGFSDPDEAIKGLDAWLYSIVSGLATQIAVREIELYLLRGKK